MKKFYLYFLAFLSFSTNTNANLPLTIEDLIADKNRFKLETNISYFNKQEKSLSDNGINLVDFGNGRSIAIPNSISENNTNTDMVIASLGIRYGINDKWDMGIKTNAVYHNQRYQQLGEFQNNDSGQIQDASLLSQYQVLNNHKTLPNTLIFGELPIYDNTPNVNNKALPSMLFGVTTYTVNDPIVLSLTTTYQYNQDRILKNNQTKMRMGDVLTVNGLVGFAVNPDVTLTGGIGWQFKEADKVLGIGKLENHKTQTNLNLGIAYALSERSNLTANVRTNISGDSGSLFSLGLTTKLGKLNAPLSERYRKIKNKE